MSIIMNTSEYIKEKLEKLDVGIVFPADLLDAFTFSLRAGLSETISCADELSRYNKELSVEVFEDTGGLEVKSRDVHHKSYTGTESYVDLTNLEGYRRSERVIWD